MKNTKHVWFVSDNAPAKLEGWLSTMARKGWFLKEAKAFYYLFEKGEPEEMEYRLLYFCKDTFKEHEQRYKEAGWDILQLSYEKYLLMAKTRQHPSETYFTEYERKQRKEKDKYMWLVSVGLGIICGLQAIDLIHSNAPGVWLNYELWNENFAHPLFMFCLGMVVLTNAVHNIQGKNYAKSVERLGREAHHKKTWFYPYANKIKIAAFMAIGVALIGMNHCGYSEVEVNRVNDDLPIITAKEIKESTGKAVYNEEYTKEHWMYTGDKYSGQFDFVEQDEFIKEVFYTKFRSLDQKAGLLSVLFDGFYLEKGTKTEWLEQEGIDCMLYAESEEEQFLAAQKSRQVLALRAPKSIAKEKLQEMIAKKLA